MNIEQITKKFDDFRSSMSSDLSDLINFYNSNRISIEFDLDFSWESLDTLENFYTEISDGKIASLWSKEKLDEITAKYMGETLRKQMGGNWDVCKDPKNINYGRPGIFEIKGLAPKYLWSPYMPLNNFNIARKAGLFKMSAMSHLDWIK